jgi:hypothetical protein
MSTQPLSDLVTKQRQECRPVRSTPSFVRFHDGEGNHYTLDFSDGLLICEKGEAGLTLKLMGFTDAGWQILMRELIYRARLEAFANEGGDTTKGE